MRRHVNNLGWLGGLGVVVLSMLGCGGGGDASRPAVGKPTASAIKRRTVDSLPAIGEYLPPLDDGKVEIAPPADWKPLPRDARYLARFVKGKASELPRITVTAWDSPLVEVADLNESNAGLLEAQLIKEMKRDKKTVTELPKPIILGSTLFLRHVRRARLPSGDHVVVQALDTVRGGRIYTIELIANIDAPRPEEYEASLTHWRDQGYAVAANLKFGGREPAPTETPAETPPPAEKSADDKPAEETPKP